jgi:hypothetical protein
MRHELLDLDGLAIGLGVAAQVSARSTASLPFSRRRRSVVSPQFRFWGPQGWWKPACSAAKVGGSAGVRLALARSPLTWTVPS